MSTQHTLTGSGGRTDEELLLTVLEGKLEAYGELYERYYPMARAIASKHTSDVNRVDDIVSESFARILQALKNGKGPHSYMGGYLATTIAHLAGEHGLMVAKEIPSEQEHLESMGSLDETVVKLHESDEVITAFTSLPERWQTVLWLTEIEAKKPREIASAMNLTPNAVSALAVRAKESLKEGFLRAHQNSPATPECTRFSSHISPYVRGSLSQKRSDSLRSHMENCNHCTAEYLSLVGINKSMRSWVFPVLAGLSIWTTDGAALIVPVAVSAGGNTLSDQYRAEGLETATNFTPNLKFSLLSPKSWGTSSQLLAGAATLTAAVVAIAGGIAISGSANESVAQVAADGSSSNQSSPKAQKHKAEAKSEKPSPLGSQFDSDPFSGFAFADATNEQRPALEILKDSLAHPADTPYSDLPALVAATAQEDLRGITAGALASAPYEAQSVVDSGALRPRLNSSGENTSRSGADRENLSMLSLFAPNSDSRGDSSSSQRPGVITSAEDSGRAESTDRSSDSSEVKAEPIRGRSSQPVPEDIRVVNAESAVATPQPAENTDPAANPETSADSENKVNEISALPTIAIDGPVNDIAGPQLPEADQPADEKLAPVENPEASVVEPTPVEAAPEARAEPVEPVHPVEEPVQPVQPAQPEEPQTPAVPGRETAPIIPSDPQKVPDWYGSAEYQAWVGQVPWGDFDKADAPGNQQCMIIYKDKDGSAHKTTKFLPEAVLNSKYTNYVVAAIYQWDDVKNVNCK